MKVQTKIIYGIIILCIVFTILIATSVLSTGNKGLDGGLVVILAIGVYLINKNIADDKYLDPEISNKIATDRDFALTHNNFNEEFKKYFNDPNNKTDELSPDDVFKQIEKFNKFLSQTKNYLNNNELSIENYFNEILPLFKNTENNKDDLKKNIIKYVVFYYFPYYNKVGVKIPPNYKKLVDLYIKDNQIATDRDYEKELNEYIQSKHKEITDPNNFVTKYKNAVELIDMQTMQNDLWHYFHKYDGITWTDISNDIILSPYTTDKLKTIYKSLNNEVAKNLFIYNVKNLLPTEINKDEYIKNLTDDSTTSFIEDVENNKEDNTELNNKMIKIKNYVDNILQESRIYWGRPDYTNLEALTLHARTQLNTMYNSFKTEYEKDFLIAYINELLKDVEEKDVEEKAKKINYIKKLPSHGDGFMNN